jgi:hypothetical protein
MGDVIKPGRRAGIQPLCPIHLKEMSGPIDETMDFYSCPQRGCQLHWRASFDYFRFYQEKPFRTFQQLQEEVLCSKAGHGHKFIAGRSGNKALWECSVEGCSETEEKSLPPRGIWEIPKEQRRSVVNEVSSERPLSTYDRAATNEAPLTKKRPGWVWAICIFYSISFVVLCLLMYLIFSGAVPMTPQLKAALARLSAFDYVVIIVQPLLSISAAVALFLLRRQATFLFWSSLAVAVAADVWQFALGSGMTAFNSRPGASSGAFFGFGIQLAVCFYAESLRIQGTLR